MSTFSFPIMPSPCPDGFSPLVDAQGNASCVRNGGTNTNSTPWWQQAVGDLILNADDIIGAVKGNPPASGSGQPPVIVNNPNPPSSGPSVLTIILIAFGALTVLGLIVVLSRKKK